jgi:uncharacterized protein YjbI with pentapeptide repeats
VKTKRLKSSEKELLGRDLRGRSFAGHDCRNADFTGSNLAGTDFTGANCQGARFTECTLDSACFQKANLSSCAFIGDDIYGVDFREANLSNAKFIRVFGKGISASSAKLRGAQIYNSYFVECYFTGCTFTEAELASAVFHRSSFDLADFEDASLWETGFLESRLVSCTGLDKLRNVRDVSLDPATLFAPGATLPRLFLLGAGIPSILVDYLPSMIGKPIQFESCFISYSTGDVEFCRRLRFEMLERGISAWLFDEDAQWGKSMWGEIDKSIRVHDRVVVVCSERSLKSAPVLREIERALRREDAEGKDILFPIRIDDYIFTKWRHPRKDDVTSKIVGDFTGWKDPMKMRTTLGRFMEGLKISEPPDDLSA